MKALFDLVGLRLDYTREMLVMGLILARTLPMIFLAPFMSGQQAPPEVKMGMGVFFSVLVWPVVSPSMHDIPMQAMPVLLLFLKETMVGFVLGFVASLLYSAMETAGRIIDTTRGAAMSEVLVPTSRSRATPIGTMFSQITLIVFVCLGGHRIYLEMFFQSFASIPLSGSINFMAGAGSLPEFMTRQCANVMGIAVIMSAPAVAATFITDLVFGILNRVAPSLNAYFMAMPVKAMGALMLLLVSTVPFYERLEFYSHQTLLATQQAIELLKPTGAVP
jgi:flagellar biosynthetic protein FliR